MEFVQLELSPYGSHFYKNASNEKMAILGLFLTSNVGYYPSSFKEWGINDDWGDETNGNSIALKKENNYILLSDLYSEEKIPTVLEMTRQQYVQIITDWEEKVCKLMPKDVIITYDNDEFVIKTKD